MAYKKKQPQPIEQQIKQIETQITKVDDEISQIQDQIDKVETQPEVEPILPVEQSYRVVEKFNAFVLDKQISGSVNEILKLHDKYAAQLKKQIEKVN